MSCQEFQSLLDAYLEDALEGEGRAELRRHLAACGGCREVALAREPALLLMLAERRQPGPEQIDACVASVMAQVRQQKLERQLGRPRTRWWTAAAAAAVIALGAGLVWRSGVVVEVPAGGPSALQPVAAEAAGDADRPGPPPRIEVDMPSDDVRVYQFAEGRDGDSAVYFVVNPALES